MEKLGSSSVSKKALLDYGYLLEKIILELTQLELGTCWLGLLMTLGLYVVSTLFNFVQGWIMSGIAADISYKFRRDIANKIKRMPLKYFDRTSQGEILSRITNDVDTVSGTLSQSLSQIITSVVTVIGVLVMMLWISWQMTLLALLIIPMSMVIVLLVIKLNVYSLRSSIA